MTQTEIEKENAALRKQLADWKDLAVEQSILADKAVATTVALTGAVTAGKATPPKPAAPAPPPPPAPAAPSPPRPARLIDFLNLSPYEKARTRDFYGGGDKLEEELAAADEAANRMHNVRSGLEVYAHGPTGEKGGRHIFITEYHEGDGHEDPREMAREQRIKEAAEAGKQIPREAAALVPGTFEYAQARADSMSASIAAGAVRRSPAGKSMFLPTSAPPVQKPARAAPRAGGFFAGGHVARHE